MIRLMRKPTLLRFADPDYEAPTAMDVRALKEVSGKTAQELCDLVGVEDKRSWRRWQQRPGEPGARQIPYAVWRLLLIELGSLDLGDDDHG